MALVNLIGIRNAGGQEPFQGIGGGSVTLTVDQQNTQTNTNTNTDTNTDTGDEWSIDTPATMENLPELLKQALFVQEGESLISIFRKAWLYNTPDDPAFKSILKQALLYVRNEDGKEVIRSILDDRLKDLAFVDAVLDFGFMRVHIKGKMIEYAK